MDLQRVMGCSVFIGVLAFAAASERVVAGDPPCGVVCDFPNPPYPVPLEVDLQLRPALQKDLAQGEVFSVGLFARQTQNVPTLVAGIEAVLTWESDKIELCGLWNNGPYDWVQSEFPDDSAGAGLNAGLHPGGCEPQPELVVPFNDGDAFYSALAQFPPPFGPGEAALLGSPLLVATLQFRVITSQPLDASICIEQTLGLACSTVGWGRGGMCSELALPCNPLEPDSCINNGVCVPLDGIPGCNILAGVGCARALGECEVPCGDADENGVTDDSCVYFDCELADCSETPRIYADLGSFNGACGPDGTCDANDRFHALNCFSDLDTGGSGTNYPCESNPPQALNVDVASLGAPCAPDGVCDSNDAFAAINCFTSSTPCSCPSGGPAPEVDPAGIGRVAAATLAARAQRSRVAAGTQFAVDVVLEQGLSDFRGYQLHLQPAGGTVGELELVDILVDSGSGGPFTGLGAWQAYNIRIGQMAAGLDTPGVKVDAGVRLATFVYRASADAAGVFTIDVLADAADDSQRTWLFPTPPQGWIEVVGTTSAVVEVQAAKPAFRPSVRRRMP